MLEEESEIMTAMRAYLKQQNMRALSFELTDDGGHRFMTSPRVFTDVPEDILIAELEEIFTKLYVEKTPIALNEYSVKAQSIKLLADQLTLMDRSISKSEKIPDGFRYIASNTLYLNLPGEHETRVRLANLVQDHK